MAKETILVADDSSAMRHFLADGILAPEGYHTLKASNGREALRMAAHHKPDLMLLDFNMPELNGMQVLKHMAVRKLQIASIFMTAHGDEGIAIDAFRLGVRDYLIKPFEPTELLDAIERSLETVRLQRKNKKLLRDLKRHNLYLNRRIDELKMLQSIGHSIADNLSVDYLKQRMIGAAAYLTNSEEGLLYLYRDGQLVCQVHKLRGDNRPHLVDDVRDDPLALLAIQGEKLEITSRDDAPTGNETRPVEAMAMPMMVGKRCIGAIVVKNYSVTAHTYNAHDIMLLKSLADYAAIALDREPMPTMKLPDLHSLNAQQQKMQDNRIFISYSRVDFDDFVKPLVQRLEQEGFETWLDQAGISGGQDWLEEINYALGDCQYLIVCVSPDALQSNYVKMEYRYFIYEEKPILPLICRPVRNLPAELRSIQHMHFADLNRVVATLQRMMDSE